MVLFAKHNDRNASVVLNVKASSGLENLNNKYVDKNQMIEINKQFFLTR